MTHTRNCIHSCCLPCNYLSIWGNVLTRQTAHGNFLIVCQMVSHPNINFLLSKQNVEAIVCIVNLRHVLSFTQRNRALQLNIKLVSYFLNNAATTYLYGLKVSENIEIKDVFQSKAFFHLSRNLPKSCLREFKL